MALKPGARLGVYEITSLLGEGGMGQVWRATDSTLGRQVAIKILPDEFAGDRARLARFEREAKMLASLNHPHIATIYGFEKSPSSHALVMEFVDGEDLSYRIARGPILLDEALPIARQIAEALEAAHDQGIIHRDLKPGNIKLRPDGTVKVLDFGLAKPTDTAAACTAVSQSPTITTPAMTHAGTVLGTAAYMSPEQAKGRPVDKRSDLWAFGAVVYEMLTGRRAFQGEDVSETIASVLRSEPDWSMLPAETPSPIRRLLRRSLVKNRKDRLADASDARLEIDEGLSSHAGEPKPSVPSRAAFGGWIVAALLASVLVVATLGRPWQSAERPPETRLEIVTPPGDDLDSFALSPDGRQIVFVASGGGPSRLWLRTLSSTTARPLEGTEGARFPFWSPDSASIAFFASNSLKRVDTDGGTLRVLAPAVSGSGGMWTAEGRIVFAPSRTSTLMSVSAGGGAVSALTALGRDQTSHRWPVLLPDGRHFLYFVQGTPDQSGIHVASLAGRLAGRLTASDSSGLFLAPNWLLSVRAGLLYAQRIDVAQVKVVGDPITIAENVIVDDFIGHPAAAVAAKDLIAYRSGDRGAYELTWFDRSGAKLGTIGPPNLLDPRIAPDGRRVIATRTVQGDQDVWLLDGGKTSRLTFDPALERFAVWSPDGARIVFRSNRSGQFDLYQKPASGAGTEDLLVSSDELKSPAGWSADGRFVFYHSTNPKSGTDLWALPMNGGRKPFVLLSGPFRESWAAMSPDGRWLAYSSNETGVAEVYVRPFVERAQSEWVLDATQWQVSSAGGLYPVWRRDGTELYYLNPAGGMIATSISASGAGLEVGASVELFPTRILGGGVENQQGRQYDVAPDGRFLINSVANVVSAPITLVQNWMPEVK